MKQIRNLENRKQAIQRNMAEYDKRAQAVLNGTATTPAPFIVFRSDGKLRQFVSDAELGELRAA